MRRLLWVSVGAAAGYYVARKVPPAVARARERGIAGNASLVASSATRAVSSTRAAFTTPAPPSSPSGDEQSTARREVRP